MSIHLFNNRRVTLFTALACATMVVGTWPAISRAQIQESVDTKDHSEVFLFKGDLVALKVYSLTRIAVSSPDIVDIANADVNEILLIGQRVGSTQIFIWDELGKRQVVATVLKEDLDIIINRMKKLLAATEITEVKLDKNNYEGKVVVTGKIPSEKKADLDNVLSKFGENILNLTKEEKREDLVQIDVQITELSTTLLKAMGIDWSSGESDGIQLAYPETIPAFTGAVDEYFKIGDFQRTSSLLATITALLQEGKGKVLSKPSVVVTNGEAASFLVGGEIPVRTTTTNAAGGSVQENVSFKTYGIDVNVTPRIQLGDKGQEMINLDLTFSTRDIDAGNAVGDNVAFTNRSANTKLLMDNGQTVVLAGLIKHSRGESVKRVPLLGSIPVIGMLFRSKSSPTADLDQELVIIITPRILMRPSEEVEAEMERATPQPEEDSPAAADVGKSGVDEAPMASLGEPAASDEQKSGFPEEELTTVVDEALSEEVPAVEMPAAEAPADKAASPLTLSPKEDIAVESSITDEGVSEAIIGYAQAVQKKIAEGVSFPYEAKEKGWEGTVGLTVTVLSDGNLQDVSVKQSSGYSIFDNDAMNTAQILAPFDPFPPELSLEEIVVTIPITYSQDLLSDDAAL